MRVAAEKDPFNGRRNGVCRDPADAVSAPGGTRVCDASESSIAQR